MTTIQPQPARREPLSEEDRAVRFDRLKSEFLEDPCLAAKERLLEAFHAWRTAGQDRRGICVEPGLTMLERSADRLIAEAERRNRT